MKLEASDPAMIKSFDRILNQALPTFLKISAVIGSAVQTQVANSSLYVYSIPFMNEAYIVGRACYEKYTLHTLPVEYIMKLCEG